MKHLHSKYCYSPGSLLQKLRYIKFHFKILKRYDKVYMNNLHKIHLWHTKKQHGTNNTDLDRSQPSFSGIFKCLWHVTSRQTGMQKYNFEQTFAEFSEGYKPMSSIMFTSVTTVFTSSDTFNSNICALHF
uniref:Uncharacterized protein n=1 Tax=Glossina austeni TaxID=7395 RepID=A0A1A9VCA4_GLOAU